MRHVDESLKNCYHITMYVELNARGNGACPICASSGKCHVQETLVKAMSAFSTKDNPMELVIYSCPQFDEKH